MNIILKGILIITGTLFIILAIIGVFLPVLPTTPFLLLAAACYFRSSNYLYMRLIGSKTLGQYIRNYYSGRGMPLKMKRIILFLLWTSILYSALTLDCMFYIRFILLAIAFGVSCHILSLKTLEQEK